MSMNGHIAQCPPACTSQGSDPPLDNDCFSQKWIVLKATFPVNEYFLKTIDLSTCWNPSDHINMSPISFQWKNTSGN